VPSVAASTPTPPPTIPTTVSSRAASTLAGGAKTAGHSDQVQTGKSFYTTKDPRSFPARQATPEEIMKAIRR
jgi:hypothetical protein